MTNVLFIHSSSELYGSDRSLLNIVKNIDRDEYNVHVILPCAGPLVEEMKKISNIKVNIFEVAVLRRKNLSIKGGLEYICNFNKSISYIKKYIKDYSIDIVDTNTAVVFPGAIAAKKLKKKSVWHIREIIKSNFENKVISSIMNKYADLIIANSKATGKALKVNPEKVRVVYNAVTDYEDTKDVIEKDRITIGMAGRINRWKGQKLFVDAAYIVHQSIPEARFKIAGEVYTGEDYIRDELVEHIKEKGLENCVQLLGQVNDMSLFYKSIDIFVLPSIQPEPFGLVVIEAMDYSLPVIATNHGGPTEIIDDGIDGYLVDFTTADEMAKKIIVLASDSNLRQKIGMKGKEKKAKNFSVKSMTQGVEKVFYEVMKS